jgi:tetratricopeptide (TPR) repeat protein
VALIPALGFLALARPDLGMPRDWDLFSVAAVPLVGAAVLVLRRLEARVSARDLDTILVPCLVLSAVLTAAWIGVNASADRSLARFEAILKYDKSRSDYAHEVLAAEYHDRGRIGRAAEVLEEALASGGPSRLAVTLSSYYEEAGRKDDAIGLLRETLAGDPRSERARYHLIRLLLSQKAYGEVLEVARLGTVLHPEKPVFHYSYGRMLLLAGQTQEGLAQLRECLRLNPPEDVGREIERILADQP